MWTGKISIHCFHNPLSCTENEPEYINFIFSKVFPITLFTFVQSVILLIEIFFIFIFGNDLNPFLVFLLSSTLLSNLSLFIPVIMRGGKKKSQGAR